MNVYNQNQSMLPFKVEKEEYTEENNFVTISLEDCKENEAITNTNTSPKLKEIKYKRKKKLKETKKQNKSKAIQSRKEGISPKKLKHKCKFCSFASEGRAILEDHVYLIHLEVSPFPCKYCDYQSGTKKNAERHMDIAHSDLKSAEETVDETVNTWSCEGCEFQIDNKHDLDKHITNIHPELRPHVCSGCDYRSNSKQDLNQHINSRHPELIPFKCKNCEFMSGCKKTLEKHFEENHSKSVLIVSERKLRPVRKITVEKKNNVIIRSRGRPRNKKLDEIKLKLSKNKKGLLKHKLFSCSECQFSSRGKSRLLKHIESEHLKPMVYKCDSCNFSSDKKIILNTHVNQEHVKPFFCSECRYRAGAKSELNKHFRDSHFELLQVYDCDKCDFTTRIKGNFTNHVKRVHIYSKSKPHQCEHCEYRSAERTRLRKHVEYVHMKLRPFECEHCQATFTSKTHKTMHVDRVHLQLKPYNCDQCPFQTAFKQSLNTHVEAVHMGIKHHPCSDCKYKFCSKADLKRHVESVHLKLKNHECSECGFRTGTLGGLKRHIDTRHRKLRPYACELCEYRAAQKGTLKKHVNGHVHSSHRTKIKNNKEVEDAALRSVPNEQLHSHPPEPLQLHTEIISPPHSVSIPGVMPMQSSMQQIGSSPVTHEDHSRAVFHSTSIAGPSYQPQHQILPGPLSHTEAYHSWVGKNPAISSFYCPPGFNIGFNSF